MNEWRMLVDRVMKHTPASAETPQGTICRCGVQVVTNGWVDHMLAVVKGDV